MVSPDHYETIKNQSRTFYKNIGQVVCPVLGNEVIHFTNSGFKHILKKGRYQRPRLDQLRRFRLLSYVKEIINDSTVSVTIRRELTAEFWRLDKEINGQIIKIVIRQKEGGLKHFFSIMSIKRTKKSPSRETL